MTGTLVLTAHAEMRCNQRGFRRATLDALLRFGASRSSGGAEVVYMDRASRVKAREALGAKLYARMERALDAYLVLSEDGRVITCAHRKKPLGVIAWARRKKPLRFSD